MFNINTHKPEHIFACMSYCGKIDRVVYKFPVGLLPNVNTLKLNAGFSCDLESGSRSEMIAKGTLEWLEEFHRDPLSFSLSNTSVKALHRKLFKYSERDDGTRGRYRTELDDDMKTLFDKTKTSLMADERHPLFTITLFRVSFIDAMPFITGNSLCTNLITYALLFNYDYSVVSQLPLIASLNNVDSTTSIDSLSLLPKTLFGLLQTRFQPTRFADSGRQTSDTYLNPRRKLLLKYIHNNAPLKISDIMNEFPNESRNTIKKDLLHLRENGMIVAHGEGRGMYYIMNNEQK